MTKDAVDKLKAEAWGELRIIRACSTCRHREWDHFMHAHCCGATGRSIASERGWQWSACGSEGKLWEPIPPKPPRAPGFWKRLGDAILARIESGKEKS